MTYMQNIFLHIWCIFPRGITMTGHSLGKSSNHLVRNQECNHKNHNPSEPCDHIIYSKSCKNDHETTMVILYKKITNSHRKKSMWIGFPILLPHRSFKVLFLREYVAWFWLPHRESFVDTSNFYNLMSWWKKIQKSNSSII